MGQDEQDLIDTLPAKSIVPPDDMDVLDIQPSTSICRAAFEGRFYTVKIIAKGKQLCVYDIYKVNYNEFWCCL